MARILVTGAAGYLASWVVQQFLAGGHTVHATVRSRRDSTKVRHLLRMGEEHPGRLVLYEADLLSAAGFDAAMQGCEIVVHTASPYRLGPSADAEKELIDPAVRGTRHVLDAVNRTPTVQRVVVTSSIVSMFGDSDELQTRPGNMLREGDVNRSSTARSNPYALSKARAEALAWEMHAQQARWTLVTIHPGAIFGPSLSDRDDATSVQMLQQFLDGSFRQGVPRLWLGIVDVRDVAQAHVAAALRSEAAGRYIIVSESLRLLQIAELLRASGAVRAEKLPAKEVPKWLMWVIAPVAGMARDYVRHNVGYPIHFDASRSVVQLDLQYRAARDTLAAHAQQLASRAPGH